MHNVANSAPKVLKTNTVTVSGPNEINDNRTVSVSVDSSHVSVRSSDVNGSAVKVTDNNNDDYKKKQPVEIQVSDVFGFLYLKLNCFECLCFL